MFRWSKGAISISDIITNKINHYTPNGKSINILLMPILADRNDWIGKNGAIRKNFLWCGQVDGYLKDVILILKAYSKLKSHAPEYKVVICGKFKDSTGEQIKETMKNLGLDTDNIILTGFIPDEKLFEYCRTATALISPLWNDQRSKSRFPTKIASYLFASRPVLTCQLGETGKYLVDKENALFFEPGDYNGLSGLMEFCIRERELASQIGKKGCILADQQFDYRRHADSLNELFKSVRTTN